MEVDATGSSPWLGDTYQRWASRGLGLQRSQTAGRVRTGRGRYLYERRDQMDGADAGAGEVAASFFADLDTSLGGLPALLGEAAPRASSLLDELQRSIAAVVEAFDFRALERSVPGLVRGLGLLRSAIAASAAAPETRFHLRLKERQLEDAILAANGVRVVAALAGPARGAVFVPGESATVRVAVETPGNGGVTVGAVRVASRGGDVLARTTDVPRDPQGSVATLQIRIPRNGRDDPAAAPYFGRDGLAEKHYSISDSTDLHLSWRRPALSAGVELSVAGHVFERAVPVTA